LTSTTTTVDPGPAQRTAITRPVTPPLGRGVVDASGAAAAEGEHFVPNADAGCRVVTTGAVACRLTCMFLLVRLGP
jgi:hypothetical protein